MDDRREIVERDYTISMLAANVWGTVLGLATAGVLVVLFWLVWRGRELPGSAISVWWLLLSVAGGIVVHELLHGLGWMLFGGVPRQAMRFGVKWKMLTPYAHSSESMPVRGYRWGILLPGLVLGLLPGVLALASGSLALLGFAALFTLAAGGDFLMLWLLRAVPPQALARDHPTKVGAIVSL